MKIAFITEMTLQGKIPADFLNMRTEFAWMHALDADHFNIFDAQKVQKYDHVFIIFPKGKVFLSLDGVRLINDRNPITPLLASNLIEYLKTYNQRVYYIQEGPHWWFNDYELFDQIGFINLLSSCDAIFAHNEHDLRYYKGLIPNINVYTIQSLMIECSIKDFNPVVEDKVLVGGNFARWYGGFESYILAQSFNLPIWGQTSHATRDGENQLINHLPRVFWTDWMKQLSSFKYAIHLMPTIAAGTFSLNCAYFGIPCIGNREVDTQRLCHPDLAVDINDLEYTRSLVTKLSTDPQFYTHCSEASKQNYNKYYHVDVWRVKMLTILQEQS